MKIQIESTSKIVNVNGVPARVWEGATEKGVLVFCFVTRIAVRDGLMPADVYAEFEADLKECAKPSVEAAGFPASMIL